MTFVFEPPLQLAGTPMGFDSGIDIERFVAMRRRPEQWLPGEKMHGAIVQAGLPKTYGTPG